MATTGEIVQLATINGYDIKATQPTGWGYAQGVGTIKTISSDIKQFEKSRYLGQLVQNGNSGEFALVSRGTARLGNIFIDDTAILLGRFGLGFSTEQFETGKAYATQVFQQMAENNGSSRNSVGESA